MSLSIKILDTYPELEEKDFQPITGKILLSDDGDGIQYVSRWDYEKPIPKGISLGK